VHAFYLFPVDIFYRFLWRERERERERKRKEGKREGNDKKKLSSCWDLFRCWNILLFIFWKLIHGHENGVKTR
jgi:hypothetical protein